MSQGGVSLGEFLEECKHFLYNLDLGGTGEVIFQHGELLETLSLVQILLMKKIFQYVAIKNRNKTIINGHWRLDINELVVAIDVGKPAAFSGRVLGFGKPMLHDHPTLGPVLSITSLGRLGNLLAKEFSFSVFINYACLEVSALRSRA